jgi:mannose-1-phosphate guanylyltransferase / mannose-6-phosphate isomerase
MSKIIPIILCGGSGTRLWPLSRKSFPKQFAPLAGEQTLLQAAVLRMAGPGFGAPVLVTGHAFRFVVADQLAAIGRAARAILVEPSARNTAPAILAAALHVQATDPNALLLIAPSDHVVADPAAFRAAVHAGSVAARAGRIVTFGVRPDRAETGYGWLELADRPSTNAPRVMGLRRFVEKPDAGRAQGMLDAGNFLWNAGIFLASAATLIKAFGDCVPNMVQAVSQALETASPDLGFLCLAADPWARADNISIDYAVMERVGNLCVVPFSAGWSDLGSWDAIWREAVPDSAGMVESGAVTAISCTGSLLRNDAPQTELVAIGLTDIVAVSMADTVLIAHRSCTQEIGAAVAVLKQKGARQAERFPQEHRPWGKIETLVPEAGLEIRRLHLHPGASLTTQTHGLRSEHWIVLSGTARVTLDGQTQKLGPNESICVPPGMRHRLENPGVDPLILIEVQTGTATGEADVTRHIEAGSDPASRLTDAA